MIDTTGPWVDVVFVDGDNYHGDGDELPNVGDMGIEEMAQYLSQWDYGDETDAAHTRDEAPWGSSDRTYNVTVGGLDYVLAVNYPLGYASLNRRPLGRDASAVYLDWDADRTTPLHAVRFEDDWNGWKVPVATAEEFRRFITASQLEDPNGEWTGQIAANSDTLVYLRPDMDYPDEWSTVGTDERGNALYALDGWTWTR